MRGMRKFIDYIIRLLALLSLIFFFFGWICDIMDVLFAAKRLDNVNLLSLNYVHQLRELRLLPGKIYS